MAPRPKNPSPDRRQEILEGALRIFARKGYTASTNADIAREAGVTPAALYYYFPSKAELFKAAISQRRAVLEPNLEQLVQAFMDLPPEVVVPTLTRMIMSFLSEEPTQLLLRIVLAEGPRDPEIVAMWQSHAVGPMAQLVMGYLLHQMEQGRIRRMDPRLMAIQVVSPVLFMLMIRDMLQIPIAEGIGNEAFLEELNHTLLHGITAKRETE